MINLYVVCSSLEDISILKNRTSLLINEMQEAVPQIKLQGYFNNKNELERYFEKNNSINDASVIVNSSGGTEDIINSITVLSQNPVLIIADRNKNSFASSLESYAFLKENFPVKLFYAENNIEKVKETAKFVKAVESIEKINRSRFCLIGSPSDWLLTSRDFKGFGNFKTKLINTEVGKLIGEVDKISEENSNKIISEWKSKYKEILVDDNSLHNSARVYLALKNLIKSDKIDFLSVRCFDLLENNYTACMALSMCNDEGITSGCEGDIPTAFTMMIAEQLSGKPVWMANPSSVNKEKNQITFAHCTAPSKFISDINEAGLTTHMESGKSTAIRGPLHNSDVTILRISSTYKKIIALHGKIIESDMKEINLCRTQAIIQINGNVEEWIENSFGNHHVIVYGDIFSELKYFCDLSSVELIRI